MLNQYKQRLENNPKFQYGTIVAYVNAISDLIEEYGENPSIEQLNAFITKKCRKRQPYAKYALKEYLIMIDREDDYRKLVPAKVSKPIKPKTFMTKERLIQLSDSISKEPYRTIAKLQVATAARAAGIITIQKKRIRKEDGRIRITLREKGDKPVPVYLKLEMWPLLEPYYNQTKKYLFLEKDADSYTPEQLHKRVSTVFKRYLEHLKEAAKKCNLDISSHDIRRSVANLVNIATNDPRVAQKLLDHSSLDVTERYLQDNSEQVADILLQHQKDL